MTSATEENYLKAIYKLSEKTSDTVSTNAIAALLDTTAASVTDMLKRLTEKGYTVYEKYRGVLLSEQGRAIATQLIRKHRLWETFMVDKLNFTWDEVHPIAEQLEHIHSEELINRLDQFLGFPKFDPHGDPIPDRDGVIVYQKQFLLSEAALQQTFVVVGVNEHAAAFLRHVEQLGLTLGTQVVVRERFEYDQSIRISLPQTGREQLITPKVCQNLFVKPL